MLREGFSDYTCEQQEPKHTDSGRQTYSECIHYIIEKDSRVMKRLEVS